MFYWKQKEYFTTKHENSVRIYSMPCVVWKNYAFIIIIIIVVIIIM